MNKWESILRLRNFGINSPRCYLLEEESWRWQLGSFLGMIGQESPLSLRTFRDKNLLTEDTSQPFYMGITREDVLVKIPELMEAGWHVILSETLPIAYISGTIGKLGHWPYTRYIVEAVFGKPVRELTHHGRIDWRDVVTGPQTGESLINQAIRQIRRAPITNCIFEWSGFNHPVGMRGENIIFWEIIPYGGE